MCCAAEHLRLRCVLSVHRGIESIARMTRLKFIALHDCNSITNNGITALSSLTRLDRLSLRGCRKLTNNGMEVVKVRLGWDNSGPVSNKACASLQAPHHLVIRVSKWFKSFIC